MGTSGVDITSEDRSSRVATDAAIYRHLPPNPSWRQLSLAPAGRGPYIDVAMPPTLRQIEPRHYLSKLAVPDLADAADASGLAVLDEAPAGVTRVALNGRLLQVNKFFCQMLGYSSAELLVRRAADITHPDDRPTDSDLLGRLLAQEMPRYSIEKRYVHKDGTPVWARVCARVAWSKVGLPLYLVTVIDPLEAPPARAPREEAPLEYEGIRVNPDRLEVIWMGQPVALRPREVLVLRYLIRHAGEILSRERLLRDVWGFSYTGGTKTLGVRVSCLRRQLPALATRLVTVGQFGYTLSQVAAGGGRPSCAHPTLFSSTPTLGSGSH